VLPFFQASGEASPGPACRAGRGRKAWRCFLGVTAPCAENRCRDGRAPCSHPQVGQHAHSPAPELPQRAGLYCHRTQKHGHSSPTPSPRARAGRTTTRLRAAPPGSPQQRALRRGPAARKAVGWERERRVPCILCSLWKRERRARSPQSACHRHGAGHKGSTVLNLTLHSPGLNEGLGSASSPLPVRPVKPTS